LFKEDHQKRGGASSGFRPGDVRFLGGAFGGVFGVAMESKEKENDLFPPYRKHNSAGGKAGKERMGPQSPKDNGCNTYGGSNKTKPPARITLAPGGGGVCTRGRGRCLYPEKMNAIEDWGSERGRLRRS